jgi:glycosyltransferase involved in cell wall biosynthesis
MRVLVTLEQRFDRTPDGALWSAEATTHSFYKRYLSVFEEVRVLARVRDVESAPPRSLRVDGDGVTFGALPYYIGPLQYARQLHRLKRALRLAVGPDDASIIRVPSPLGSLLVPILARMDRPICLEVVGDPYDQLAPGATRHPLRPFLRWLYTQNLRRECQMAAASAYVTEHALQARYPPSPGSFTTHYSSVELTPDAFATGPRGPRAQSGPLSLITVGSLALLGKGVDILLEALAICVRNGLDLTLSIVGDGRYRPELEAHALRMGLGDRVLFAGRLPAGQAIRALLEKADMYVHPSRQEGLPRAMIEAMAMALPCIGSSVGGIPELLLPAELVPPNDAPALARKLEEVLTDPMRMVQMSRRNLEFVERFREERLNERRFEFYSKVREYTESWVVRSRRRSKRVAERAVEVENRP